MVEQLSEIDVQLGELETRLDRLRSLYEQYFMGIERLEPHVPRKDVDRRVQALRKTQIRNTAQRFRFNMLIQRLNTYQMYWQRICRQIEDGTYKRHVLRAQQRFQSMRVRERSKTDPAPPSFDEADFGDYSLSYHPSDIEELGGAVVGAHDPLSELKPQKVPRFESPRPPPPPAAMASANPTIPPNAPSPPPSSPRIVLRKVNGPTVAPRPAGAGHTAIPGAIPHGNPASPTAPPLPVVRAAAPPLPTVTSFPKPTAPPLPTVSAHTKVPAPLPTISAAHTKVPAPLPTVSAAHPKVPAPLPMGSVGSKPSPPMPTVTAAPPSPNRASISARENSNPPLPTIYPDDLPPLPTVLPRDPAGANASAAQPRRPVAKPVSPNNPSVAASTVLPTRAASLAPKTRDPDLSDNRIRELYREYVEAKRRTNESTAAITYEGLAKSLRESSAKLRDKHGKTIDFEVVSKDGKAVIKPVIK